MGRRGLCERLGHSQIRVIGVEAGGDGGQLGVKSVKVRVFVLLILKPTEKGGGDVDAIVRLKLVIHRPWVSWDESSNVYEMVRPLGGLLMTNHMNDGFHGRRYLLFCDGEDAVVATLNRVRTKGRNLRVRKEWRVTGRGTSTTLGPPMRPGLEATRHHAAASAFRWERSSPAFSRRGQVRVTSAASASGTASELGATVAILSVGRVRRTRFARRNA